MARRNDVAFRLTCICLTLSIFLIPELPRADADANFDVQAHRGGRARRPENTLAAFAHAIELGVDTLEMDLAVTRDRVVVISHDYRLNPTITRGPDGQFLGEDTTILIKDLDYQQLQRFSVGEIRRGSDYWYRFRDQVAVPGEKVPSLDQVFELVDNRGADDLRFNLEIKTYPPFPDYTIPYEEVIGLVLESVRKYGMESRVTIQSFDWRTLKAVKERSRDIAVACLTVSSFSIDGAWYNLQPNRDGPSPWLAGLDSDEFESIADLVHAFGAEIYSPYYREIERRDVEEAHRLGLKVIPWTVNDRRIMKKMIGWGVEGIITDEPEVLIQVLEE